MPEKKLIFLPQQSSRPATDNCVEPEIGQLLIDYVADDLEDLIAEKVEDHLLLCRSCRENLLKVSKILSPRHYIDDTHQDQLDDSPDKPPPLTMVRSTGNK